MKKQKSIENFEKVNNSQNMPSKSTNFKSSQGSSHKISTFSKSSNYKTISLVLIFFLIFLLVILISLINGNNNDVENNYITLTNKEYKNISLEVYHFHGNNQCVSCIAVGDLAEKTINTYFKEELETGKIEFAHINGELEENRDLVLKYEATGSSLWIGTYLDGKFNKEENTRVWYKINNEQDYMTYLKSEIEKRLSGDLS